MKELVSDIRVVMVKLREKIQTWITRDLIKLKPVKTWQFASAENCTKRVY